MLLTNLNFLFNFKKSVWYLWLTQLGTEYHVWIVHKFSGIKPSQWKHYLKCDNHCHCHISDGSIFGWEG